MTGAVRVRQEVLVALFMDENDGEPLGAGERESERHAVEDRVRRPLAEIEKKRLGLGVLLEVCEADAQALDDEEILPEMLALMVALCVEDDLTDGVLVTIPVREGRGDTDAEGE